MESDKHYNRGVEYWERREAVYQGIINATAAKLATLPEINQNLPSHEKVIKKIVLQPPTVSTERLNLSLVNGHSDPSRQTYRIEVTNQSSITKQPHRIIWVDLHALDNRYQGSGGDGQLVHTFEYVELLHSIEDWKAIPTDIV